MQFSIFCFIFFYSFIAYSQNEPIFIGVTAQGNTSLEIGKNQVKKLGLYILQGDSLCHKGWDNIPVYDIAVNKKNKNNYFIACPNGVLKSDNSGISWKIITDWKINDVRKILLLDNEQIVVGTTTGIWLKEKKYLSWIKANNGLTPTSSTYITDLLLWGKNNDSIIAATSDGLYVSNLNLKHWDKFYNGEDITNCIKSPKHELFVTSEQNKICKINTIYTPCTSMSSRLPNTSFYSLIFNNKSENTLYTGGFKTGLFVSQNEGETWKMEGNESLKDKTITAIFMSPENLLYVGTYDGGVYLSTDEGKTFNCKYQCNARISFIKGSN